MHRSAKLQTPPPSCTFFLFVWLGWSQTGRQLSFVFSRSNCHLTIITLIHWITMIQYKLKRCSNKDCCKQCRYVMFKGTMTKWPVQKLTQGSTQKLIQHHDRYKWSMTVAERSMHRSAKFQTPPNAVDLLWSCEGLWRGLSFVFLGQIVTWQYNPNLFD